MFMHVVFLRQQSIFALCFIVHLYICMCVLMTIQTGKLKKSNLTFKKLSSWCSHIQVRGRPDPTQIKAITTITKETPQLDPVRGFQMKSFPFSTNFVHSFIAIVQVTCLAIGNAFIKSFPSTKLIMQCSETIVEILTLKKK